MLFPNLELIGDAPRKHGGLPNNQFDRKKDNKKNQQSNKRKMPLSLNPNSHQDKENKLESLCQDLDKELLKD